MNYKVVNTHINLIQQGDLVIHDGRIKTVSGTDIKRHEFMGKTLFGDSYLIGHKPVKRVILEVAA